MQNKKFFISIQPARLSNLFALFLCILVLCKASMAQGDSPQKDHAAVSTLPGIVVEAVQKGFAAEKAGLQVGDTLLSWKRTGVDGKIESPFDLFFVEADQAPRSPVALEGLRGEEKLAWQLGPEVWGLESRPNFIQKALDVYLSGQQLEKAGKVVEAAKRWRIDFGDEMALRHSSWLPSWMSFHAAEMLAQAQKWPEADDAYRESIVRAHGADPAITTQLFQAWAATYRNRSDWSTAEKYYSQAVENQRQAANADNLVSARALNSMGYVNFLIGNLPAAEKYYLAALDIKKKSAPESLTLAGTLDNLGNVFSEYGDYAKAEQYYAESLEIKEKLVPGNIDTARTFNNLGINAASYGDYAKAEQYYRGALDFIEKHLSPGSFFEATVNNNLSWLALARHDLDKAEAYAMRSLIIRKQLEPEGRMVASSLNNLGLVASARGDCAEAMKYYRESLAIKKLLEPNSLNLAAALANLGDCSRRMKDLPQAEVYLKQALEIALKLAPKGESVGDILSSLGDVAKDQGDLNNAEIYYRQSLAIREKNGPGSGRNAEALANLAWVMRQNQKLDLAADLYLQALNALDSQIARLGGSEDARSDFRAIYESYYKDYIDLLMTRKQPELAFHTLERVRARALLEMLATARLDVRGAVEPALLNQEQSLQAQLKGKINYRLRLLSDQHDEKRIEALDKEISGLLQKDDELKARIRANSPRYAALTQPQPLNSETVQHLLPDNTLLLEYSLGETHSYVFAVTTSSLHAYELPSRMNIERTAERFYRLITERSRTARTENDRQRHTRLIKADADSRDAALELSRMVLGPVAAELQARRLLIVSDRALQYIPFAALPEPEFRFKKIPTPLMLRHELINLPSASVLALLRQEPKRGAAQKEVAVFADPVFDSRDSRVKAEPIKQGTLNQTSNKSRSVTGTFLEPASHISDSLTRSVVDMNLIENGVIHLPRLAFTRDEAKAIMAVVTPGMGMEALGFNASRNLAVSGELARYRVIHFATHALVDNIQPELSGLVLSLVDKKGVPMDGFLELQDIYNLDLSADLVVLSACQTALGKQINGEGMIGLTRGFIYAGASHVLATLWKVDDFATALFMAHFYKALERDKMTPAQALRQAQLALGKNRSVSTPYFWAGFVLQGDWQ
jgi:CHAT domain-containing protein/Tfp pilus assembly protein PilF